MFVTVQLKLLPSKDQEKELVATLKACNTAANWLSEQSFAHGVLSQFDLQKRFYRNIRDMFDIGSMAACLICAKVSDAYKISKKVQCKFRPTGSMAFNRNNLNIYLEKSLVSIWTLKGRARIKFECGEYQKKILAVGLIKESDLIQRRDGAWFLSIGVSLPDAEEAKASDALGVDLGLAVIAADSDGNKYSGSQLNKARYRNRSLKRKLQKKGTKSSRRLLKKRSGKESRFARDINHTISKRIVFLAKSTNRAIAIEDLTGIGRRIKARKREKAKLSSWSFCQLGEFIQYKAKMNGVRVVRIDPHYTSQKCNSCGHIDKANRKTRDEFHCKSCGHTAHSDENGARNIRLKGLKLLGSGDSILPNAGVISHAN
jgi:putative transposase